MNKILKNLIRKPCHIYLSLQGKIQIYPIKKRLKKKINVSNYKNISSLSVCFFPNESVSIRTIFDDGYAINKIFAVCGIRAIQFHPWRQFDLIVNWQDLTVNHIDVAKYIAMSCENKGVKAAIPDLQMLNRIISINPSYQFYLIKISITTKKVVIRRD